MRFDDQLWRDVWDRNLDAVERHSIAVDVWRRRRPGDPFEALVAFELARRWRRQSVSLALVYLLWTAFWGVLAIDDVRIDATLETLLSPVCAFVGLFAIGACMVVRRRLGAYLRAHAAPLR